MLIEKSKISNLQLMFLTSAFIGGSVLYIAFMDSIAFHDSWLVILTAYVVSIPFILSYVMLIKRFPDMSFIQIVDIIYGPYLGKVISSLYFLYFFWVFILNLHQIGIFYTNLIMPETPQVVFVIMFALACAYAVRSGIEVIARISHIIIIFVTLVVISTFVLLLNEMDFTNLLPILEIPLNLFVQSTHIIVSIHFCELVAFLMVLPSSNNIKKAWSATFIGLTITAALFVAVSIRNTAVIGAASSIYIDASFQAVRHISIGGFLTRIEILIGIAITVTLFIKTSVLYYATVSSISQILELRSLLSLILPIGGIAIIIAIFVHDSSVGEFNDAINYYPILVIPFEIILPLLSLIIAKIRKLPRKLGGESK